jgi:hypothetical protein
MLTLSWVGNGQNSGLVCVTKVSGTELERTQEIDQPTSLKPISDKSSTKSSRAFGNRKSTMDLIGF